ncbi:CBS domain-containing protein [Halobacillus sp. A5]|uniref:CBS domain-containing protein n=1 Tax=Halobacillus sp. A5 TaxID=2880263 RepID=UPI0020A631A4|nr:CBS domain-containing protein [Halobacillus sp. A5]MCP3027815.1 CBS domain-containing protein [Halobacillus sp. A5]
MSKVKDVMTTNLTSCKSSDDLATLSRMMRDDDVGFVPIVDGEEFVGVVTDRDIVVNGLAKGSSGEIMASDVMTEKVITGYPEMEIEEAARLMQEHQIRRLLIVENTSIKGVITLGDIGWHGIDEAAAGIVREVSKGEGNN